MGLQLKGDNSDNNKNNNTSNNEYEFGGDSSHLSNGYGAAVGGTKDPWEYNRGSKDIKDMDPQPIVSNASVSKDNNSAVSSIIKIVMAFVIVGLLIFLGKKLVSVVLPEGEDVTQYIKMNEKDIAAGLKTTFSDNAEWVPQIHQWTNNGKVTVHSDENIGVVYIDGKQTGIHIHTKKYMLYNIRIGMGEVEVNKGTTYKYDNMLSVLDDMKEGKTTTYYYYNQAQNDCIAVTINDTTNRVTGITYFNDFKKVTESLE